MVWSDCEFQIVRGLCFKLILLLLILKGGDLDQFLRRRKGNYMSEGEVLQLFVQISLAIKHTHDRKVLHRDLKPGVSHRFPNKWCSRMAFLIYFYFHCFKNIFLTRSGLVKLGDFGVSKVLKNTGEFAVTQIGTPYYVSVLWSAFCHFDRWRKIEIINDDLLHLANVSISRCHQKLWTTSVTTQKPIYGAWAVFCTRSCVSDCPSMVIVWHNFARTFRLGMEQWLAHRCTTQSH